MYSMLLIDNLIERNTQGWSEIGRITVKPRVQKTLAISACSVSMPIVSTREILAPSMKKSKITGPVAKKGTSRRRLFGVHGAGG